MGGLIDPTTGNLCAHAAGVPTLTPEQRALADSFDAWRLADGIVTFTNSPEGGRWFSKWKIKADTSTMAGVLQRGEGMGLWRSDPAKPYWHHTALTWPWCMTALALWESKHGTTPPPMTHSPDGQSKP